MPTSKKPGIRRVKKRRTSVSIGGVSQSAFAGYATTTNQSAKTPKPSTENQNKSVNEQDEPSDEKNSGRQ